MPVAMFGSETIGERLTATRGRTTGFDYLRAGLSISVIALHSVLTSYGEAYTRLVWNGWWRPFIAVILPAFFALSGFLVSEAGQPDRRLLLRHLHLRLRDPAGLCLPLPWFPGLVGEYRRLPDRGLRLRGAVLALAGEAGAGEPETCRRGGGEGGVLHRPPTQGSDAGSKTGTASQADATGICRYRRRLVMVARPC